MVRSRFVAGLKPLGKEKMEYVYSRSEVLQGQFTVDKIKIIIYQLIAVTLRSK
jgi:hypothetical protein